MIGPADETAREPTGPGFSDAVTFAWGDRAQGLYGLARAGLSSEGASALAVLFADREPVAATARGGIETAAGEPGFEDLDAGGVHTTVTTPLQQWTVAFDGGDAGFALTFEAVAPPVEIDDAEPVARTGGMTGYEQLCRVTGTVRTAQGERTIACPGQRTHSWGEPDWEKIDSTRTITAWLDDGTGVAVNAVRPAGKKGHDADATWAALLDPAGSLYVDEARVSTTYDGDGRQRRAGLELWVGEDDGYPRRAAGQVLCGSTFDLGQLRLDCAFFGWSMHGRQGIGRYDVVRRA